MSMPVCPRCTKSIATKFVSCTKCLRKFHPGCSDSYITYRNAKPCCVLSFTQSTSNSFTTLKGSSQSVISASAVSPAMPPKQNLSQSRASLNNSSSNKLDIILDKLVKIESTIEQQAKTNEEIVAKLEDQDAINKLILSKLELISVINDKVEAHEEQILDLKLNLEHLSQAFATHTTVGQTASQPLAAEIILAGIPSTLTYTEREIASMILTALGVPELATDILDIRVLPKKTNTRNAQATIAESQNTTETISFVLKLKSLQVRDHIISKTRGKSRLAVKEVFSNNESGFIYINELLPADIYKLKNATKAKAVLAGFRYVWVKSGRVFARKSDGEPVIQINSEADLSKLV